MTCCWVLDATKHDAQGPYDAAGLKQLGVGPSTRLCQVGAQDWRAAVSAAQTCAAVSYLGGGTWVLTFRVSRLYSILRVGLVVDLISKLLRPLESVKAERGDRCPRSRRAERVFLFSGQIARPSSLTSAA